MSLRRRIDEIIEETASPLVGSTTDFRSQQLNNQNTGSIGQVISISGGSAQVLMSDGSVQTAAIGLRTVTIGDTCSICAGLIF